MRHERRATKLVTDGKQWVGTAPNQLLTEGGAIGCDKESNGLTSALDSGGSALIVAQAFLEGMPKDTYSITESWQVVGDRVLIPQPTATVGDGLDATTVDSIRYNGKDVSGSSISLAALRAVINRLATER
jgi:hypothetical protein